MTNIASDVHDLSSTAPRRRLPPSTTENQPRIRRTSSTRPRRRLGPGRALRYGRVLGPLLLIAAWSAASAAGLLDERILPTPWNVVATAGNLLSTGELQSNMLTSVSRAGLGLLTGVAVGTVLAASAGLSRIGEALIDGWMQVQRALPALGLIPLMILWLGIGEPMKVVVISLSAAIFTYVNTYASLTGIDSRYVELAEVVGLSRWQFIRRVVAPGALPGFFVGLRLSVTSSWVALIVVEQINATSGLGYMMFQAQQYAQTEVIIVGLGFYGLFGFVSDAVLRIMERRVLSWRRTLSS